MGRCAVRQRGRWMGWCRAASCGVVLLLGATALRAQDGVQGQSDRPEMPAGSQIVRGTVTAVTPEMITLKGQTGEIYKVTVTPNTRVMKERQVVKAGEIKAGDGVGAMGVLDAPTKTLHAVFVTVIDAEQIKKAQADLGKTYIAGEVTAIDELKLTIKRADGVVQTIAVDEGTSFKRGGRGLGMMGGSGNAEGAGGSGQGQRSGRQGAGSEGESITLADLKVGDSVIGRGALKGGIFVPAELRVMDASARGRRRGGGMGAAPAAPAPEGAPR